MAGPRILQRYPLAKGLGLWREDVRGSGAHDPLAQELFERHQLVTAVCQAQLHCRAYGPHDVGRIATMRRSSCSGETWQWRDRYRPSSRAVE